MRQLHSVSFHISVMYSLFQSIGNPLLKLVVNIGFPFKYYYQFWLSGSNSPNCGWVITYFIYDVVIVWGIIAAFFILKIKYLKK